MLSSTSLALVARLANPHPHPHPHPTPTPTPTLTLTITVTLILTITLTLTLNLPSEREERRLADADPWSYHHLEHHRRAAAQLHLSRLYARDELRENTFHPRIGRRLGLGLANPDPNPNPNPKPDPDPNPGPGPDPSPSPSPSPNSEQVRGDRARAALQVCAAQPPAPRGAPQGRRAQRAARGQG